ncbi:Sll0314/Alr1548 family TPR repeat-containing protein [Calothrix sp. 336/3]|uniref:Sll0314/Alr1548 family TPR repeat-containing protein n=1 Tax=Calothrix sp. 336/3 TaxID=1337936 RepID=UPI0004E45B11|nr:Sll0314/Alr1548 family TPR repeat-containing protein [Calothrix sp. 336/3]AKG22058.1 tetratricopeptide TPR_2 [Calothrix sp. 336/3]
MKKISNSFSKRLPGTLVKFLGVTSLTLLTTLSLNIVSSPSDAADPFRTKDTRKIGDRTEAAFKAIFLRGNYTAAEGLLQEAISKEPDEPLAHAMKASLAYTNKDWSGLETYSQKTLAAAQKLTSSDPLRGYLYTSVGYFLEGAVILRREGTVNGATQALNKLKQVYEYLDKAEAIAPEDPELNLLKGYMDLMLAVNLPFANPEQAIDKLEKNSAPQYLTYRGIAIAYRDLKRYNEALEYVNRTLTITADNPEVYYLKAQILRAQANKDNDKKIMQEAIVNFDKALSKKSQLPSGLIRQIEKESRNARKTLGN